MSIFDDRTILITGGTGSFGKAFVRYLSESAKPRKIVIFSRDEFKQSEMAKEFPDNGNSPYRYLLGDIRDRDRLRTAFNSIDFVIHAAALKQAPAGEHNTDEFVKTNVLGAQNVIDAAISCDVQRVVALSTDKACNPLNAYGASKLMLEKLFVNAAAVVGYRSFPIFTVCRYGNVIGSRGSVVPLFRDAFKAGTPFQITDERMTRFVITMNQAIALVVQAFQAKSGDILIPKLPAADILTTCQAIGGESWPLRVIGIRPGEKIHEALISRDEPYIDLATHYCLRKTGGTGLDYTSEHAYRLSPDELKGLIE